MRGALAYAFIRLGPLVYEKWGIIGIIGLLVGAAIIIEIIYYISVWVRKTVFPKIFSFIKIYHHYIEQVVIFSGITLITVRLFFPIQYRYSYIGNTKIIVSSPSSHIAPTVETGATLLQVLAIAIVVVGLVYLLRISFDLGQHDPARLHERAIEFFAEKKYTLARFYWAEALKSLEKMGKQRNEFAGKCLYHIADTHFWEGEYSDCINLLQELKKEYPMFEAKKVDELIKLGQLWQNASREENLWSAAEKAFNRRDYPSARLYYKWLIEHWLETGEDSDSYHVLNVKYEIAFTYFSEGNYERARQKLLELKNNYPNYSAMEKVDELLVKLEKAPSRLWRYPLN